MEPLKTKGLIIHTYTSLSIQVRLDGLSFFTQNPVTKELGAYDTVRFRESVDPSQLVNHIERAFSEHPVLTKEFKKITVVYDNDLYTVVPSPLFDASQASDYLKFNTKILNTDFVAHDVLEDLEKVVVYIPYTNVNNFFFDKYGSFEFYHSTSLFLKDMFQKTSANDMARVFTHIKETSFDLAIIEKNQLLLINTYKISSPEDYIYYLLFAYEQLHLDPNKIPLDLLGKVDTDSKIYKAAYKYIRHCTLIERPPSVFHNDDSYLSALL